MDPGPGVADFLVVCLVQLLPSLKDSPKEQVANLIPLQYIIFKLWE